MNFKTTILLVALLIIVGAVWLFFPRGAASEREIAPPLVSTNEQKPVFDPPPRDDQLVRFAVERAGKPRMVFERVASETPGANDWRMVEPLATPADGNKLIGLIRTLTGLQAKAAVPEGSQGTLSAADAGLEPPAMTLTLADKEGKQYKLEIGRKAAMSNDTYLRVAGQPTIQLTMRDLRPQFDKDAKDFRALHLIKFKPDEAIRLGATFEGKTYEFSKGPDGEWIIDAPLKAFADRSKILSKLLTPLSTLQAAEFLPDSPESLATYGLDEPYLTLTVTTEQKPAVPPPAESQPASQPAPVTETQRLLIGGFADLKSERRYVKTDAGPSVAIVAQSSLNALVPKLSELRDWRVTRVKPADIAQIDLTVGDTTAALKKVNGVWQGTGDLAALETDAVSDVADAFATLTAISFVDEPEQPAKYGLDQPRAVITATAAGSLTPVTLRIGGETASGRNAYAQRDGDATVFVVGEAQAARLAISPLALRSREIFTFAPELLQTVQVERGTARYALARDGESWKLAEPDGAPTDIGAVTALTTDLSRLRAKRVVAKDDVAGYGLDHPALTVRFTVVGTPASSQPIPTEPPTLAEHTLLVGSKDNVGYARKDDDPYVFELDDTVYRVLIAELIDPRIFSFKPDEVVGIKVVATGGTLELAKEGSTWNYVADPYVALDQKKVQDLARDISLLRAEVYLAYRDGDLAKAGLTNAPASLSVRLADGRELVMPMTQARPGELPRVAGFPGEQRVFLLRQADCEKLMRGLDEYVKSERPEQPEAPPGPGMPGMPGMPPGDE